MEIESWISRALLIIIFHEILQKASLYITQSKPYAKSEVKQFIGKEFNLEIVIRLLKTHSHSLND